MRWNYIIATWTTHQFENLTPKQKHRNFHGNEVKNKNEIRNFVQ